jgi:hypothetical protein
MNNILIIPSFYAHIFSGLLLLITFILIYLNYKKLIGIEPYRKIVIVLLLSICIGLHGISHIELEKYYNYNPLNMRQYD